MAIYGVSLYGLDKYGPPVSAYVNYAVDPFVSEATDYDNILLQWQAPRGDWQRLRVLRSSTGFPATETNGRILLDTTAPVLSLSDSDVTPGAWHYYSIWIQRGDGGWQQSATTCCLMLQEYGYSSLLFDSLPQYHRLEQGLSDNLPMQENDSLKAFLEVLGMGMNYIKTYASSALFLNDPLRNRTDQLLLLAQQLGVHYSPATPPELFRQRMANAATLDREKGTLEQIQTMVSLTTGWNIDLALGQNIMLNEDQASFVHPTYPQWDPGVNYPIGSRVIYSGYVYTAKVGVIGTSPTGNTTDNASWGCLQSLVDTTLRQPDGTFAGWSPVSFTAGVPIPTNLVSVGVGVQSPTDPTVSSANTLAIVNNGATVADLGVRSAGGSTLSDPLSAIRRGIPITLPFPYFDITKTYFTGDTVRFLDRSYAALRKLVATTPTDGSSDANWALVSPYDNRPMVIASLHAKGTTSNAQTRLVYPVVDFFDEHGNPIATVDTSAAPVSQVYDPLFTSTTATIANRATPVGGKMWTVGSGSFRLIEQQGMFCTGLAGGPAYAYTSGSTANGQVAVTIDSNSPGQTPALFVRRTTGGNFLKFTQTAAYEVTNSVVGPAHTYSIPAQSGDRISVSFSGNNIVVSVNGSVVQSFTSALNPTSTTHGIMVE